MEEGQLAIDRLLLERVRSPKLVGSHQWRRHQAAQSRRCCSCTPPKRKPPSGRQWWEMDRCAYEGEGEERGGEEGGGREEVEVGR